MKTYRDMLLSMGLLTLLALGFVALNGGLSFAPTGPGMPQDSQLTVDASAEFAHANRLLPFTPAVPTRLPGDWKANSADTTDPTTVPAGRPLTARAGWLTPTGFIALVASNAEPGPLLVAEFGSAAPQTGTITVAGDVWAVTTGVRGEAAWYRRSDAGVTYLITGNADGAAFGTLAGSIAGG